MILAAAPSTFVDTPTTPWPRGFRIMYKQSQAANFSVVDSLGWKNEGSIKDSVAGASYITLDAGKMIDREQRVYNSNDPRQLQAMSAFMNLLESQKPTWSSLPANLDPKEFKGRKTMPWLGAAPVGTYVIIAPVEDGKLSEYVYNTGMLADASQGVQQLVNAARDLMKVMGPLQWPPKRPD